MFVNVYSGVHLGRCKKRLQLIIIIASTYVDVSAYVSMCMNIYSTCN